MNRKPGAEGAAIWNLKLIEADRETEPGYISGMVALSMMSTYNFTFLFRREGKKQKLVKLDGCEKNMIVPEIWEQIEEFLSKEL